MLVYRMTRTSSAGRAGLFGNQRTCGTTSWKYDFREHTEPTMKFGCLSYEEALRWIQYASDHTDLWEEYRITITVYDVPDEYVARNPRRTTITPHALTETEVLFHPHKKRRVVRRIYKTVREYLNELSTKESEYHNELTSVG